MTQRAATADRQQPVDCGAGAVAESRRDHFGRLLAYVHAGGKNVNVELVRRGHADYWTKFGKGPYAEQFQAAEEEAGDRISAPGP